jgi:hypothetical protein
MLATSPPIHVNRAPVLTRWQPWSPSRWATRPRLRTFGGFVAGSGASGKARRLDISDEKEDAEERHAKAAELTHRRQTVHPMDRKAWNWTVVL